MSDGEWTTGGLWLAVVGLGLYHGLNPGMGWPLAVSAALMQHSQRAFAQALAMLAAGHFAAMAMIMLPFALLSVLAQWHDQIRIGAAVIVIGFGAYLLISRRHPRLLARIPPSRLALWSFLVATAHGAGLMLVPMFLGLCTSDAIDTGHAAAARLMAGNIATALAVAGLHTAAMVTAGGMAAFAVYRWLGLKALSKGWFNLDAVWAASLVGVGILALL